MAMANIPMGMGVLPTCFLDSSQYGLDWLFAYPFIQFILAGIAALFPYTLLGFKQVPAFGFVVIGRQLLP